MHPASDRGKVPGSTLRPLEGKRICLVFEHSLSHYGRLLLEIEALQLAGATVQLVTQHPIPDGPADVPRVYAPLGPHTPLVRSIGWSSHTWMLLRRADNLLRKPARILAAWWTSRVNQARYSRTLQMLGSDVDLFWVIDFPRLGAVIASARVSGARVVYETVDLVPEYVYYGEQHRQKCLDDERRLIGDIDGFITASDSYADYYVEFYGLDRLGRRPVVRDNMPRRIASEIVPTTPPLRFLFLGSLMFDRPVLELIEAVAEAKTDMTLTFRGKNHLDVASARRVADRIAQLGLQGRVEILDPCPPGALVATAREHDVGIVALRGADENERRASTGKLFTYMAAGLAVLGSDLPGIARIVHAHDNGMLVDGVDPHAWAVAFDRLGSLPPASIDLMKERSLGAANHYAWDKQEAAFVGEFVRALSGQSHRMHP